MSTANANPVSGLFNHAINWTNDLSHSDKHAFVKSRLSNILTLQAEVVAKVGQAIIAVPVNTIRFAVGVVAKLFWVISGSETLRKFGDAQPNLTGLLKTVCKVIGYAFGIPLTATLGFLSPQLNLRAHCFMGLATNKQELRTLQAERDAIKAAAEQLKRNIEQQANKLAEELKAEKDATMADAAEVIAQVEKKAEETFQSPKQASEVINNAPVNEKTIADRIEEALNQGKEDVEQLETEVKVTFDQFKDGITETAQQVKAAEEEGAAQITEEIEKAAAQFIVKEAVDELKEKAKEQINSTETKVTQAENAVVDAVKEEKTKLQHIAHRAKEIGTDAFGYAAGVPHAIANMHVVKKYVTDTRPYKFLETWTIFVGSTAWSGIHYVGSSAWNLGERGYNKLTGRVSVAPAA